MANPHSTDSQQAALIHFACRTCRQPLTVAALFAGVSGPCPHCGEIIVAPVKPLPDRRGEAPKETRAESPHVIKLPTAGRSSAFSDFLDAARSPFVRAAVFAGLIAAFLVYREYNQPQPTVLMARQPLIVVANPSADAARPPPAAAKPVLKTDKAER